MENTLKSHLFIELYYRLDKRFLNEHLENNTDDLLKEYGVFNNCEGITKKVYNVYQKNKGKEGTFNIIIDNDWIEEVIVNLKHLKTNTFAEYDATNSTMITNVKGDVKRMRIIININSLYTNPKREFVGIMHELQHAYEDYNRAINNKDSIADTALEHGYVKNIVGSYNNVNKNIISNLLYYIERFERNAYFAEITGELKNTDDNISSVEDAMKYVESLDVYKLYYETIPRTIDSILVITDRNKQNEVISYFEELSNLKFNSFKQLKNYLKKEKRNIINKLDILIPKIIYANKVNGKLRISSDKIADSLKKDWVIQ